MVLFIKNQAARQYIEQTLAELECGAWERLYYRRELRHIMRRFLDDRPDAMEPELWDAFGSPGYMANEMTFCEWKTHGAQRRRGRRKCASMAVTAAVCAACVVATVQPTPQGERPVPAADLASEIFLCSGIIYRPEAMVYDMEIKTVTAVALRPDEWWERVDLKMS